jgi:hypothetical protein
LNSLETLCGTQEAEQSESHSSGNRGDSSTQPLLHTIKLLNPSANSFLQTDCWAAGAATGGCGHLEKALRECMDAPVRFVLPLPFLSSGSRNLNSLHNPCTFILVVATRPSITNICCQSHRKHLPKTNLPSTTIFHVYSRTLLDRRGRGRNQPWLLRLDITSRHYSTNHIIQQARPKISCSSPRS